MMTLIVALLTGFAAATAFAVVLKTVARYGGSVRAIVQQTRQSACASQIRFQLVEYRYAVETNVIPADFNRRRQFPASRPAIPRAAAA